MHRLSAERLPELGRQYHAVTLTDVLEHIPEPVALLSIVRRVVAERRVGGGQGAVRPAQLLKETWRARLTSGYRATLADNLVHINHFSPRALRLALERAGFDDITVEIAAPECPPGARGSSAPAARALQPRPARARWRPHADRPAPAGVRARRDRVRRRAARHDGSVPSLSVVIPTYNNEAVLRRCLTSWRRSAAACDVEIIVIEDGCRDGTRAFLESESQSAWGQRHLRWIHMDDAHELRCTNAGLAAARAPLDDGLAGRHVRDRATGSSPELLADVPRP